ncbi:MAG: ATP-binding protein [Gammaproteobacteria bacterium]|nr:ATP-binding protein [Gammaproteobacteria bacterium]
MNESSHPTPGVSPLARIGLPSGLTLRTKGLGMLLVVIVYAFFMAIYATAQKNELLERFNELQRLHETESELLLTELAAFRDITEFFLFIDAELLERPENLREQIQALQRRQLAVMARYPEIAPTFAELSHALARAISSPGSEALADVRAQLANTQRHLQQLAGQITTRQRVLADEYYALGDSAAMNSLLLGLSGVVTIGLVAMYFFTGLTRDIKRLEQRLDDVVHGYRGAPLPVRRRDELGQLTRDVNRMVEELGQREKDLEIERRKTFQQEKMASIGTLAAGIVHEIGNPVAAISGLLSTLQEEQSHAPNSHEARLEKLDMVQRQVERLAAIARDVSDFAVPQSGKRELLNLNGLIENTNRFMRFDRRLRNVEVVLDLNPGLPAIYGVSDQLVQLLMNLMINAADAMEGHREAPPRIAISTFRVGSGVGLQLEDNGHGMDEETLDKALDPFFTTKGAGKGTGLGLPLCYTVVSEHGGTLHLDSRPGHGTRVRVILPVDGRARPRPAEEAS